MSTWKDCGKGFYLVTTDHLSDKIWFRDEEDFKAGMNAVPVIALAYSVKVVAFILMSNHVHFLLYCTREEAEQFISAYKGFYSRYLSCKYGIREMLRDNKHDIQLVIPDGESLERVVAYIQMNCVAANICLSSTDYRWGTGDAFFRTRPAKGVSVNSLSKRARGKLMHSWKELPDSLLIGEDGYILPSSYVDVKLVESLFGTPKRMSFFLRNSSKAKLRLSAENADLPSFRDQVIAAALEDLCHTLFRKGSIKNLSEQQLAELLRQLRFRFSSHAEQLARVCGISYDRVVALLESPDTGAALG